MPESLDGLLGLALGSESLSEVEGCLSGGGVGGVRLRETIGGGGEVLQFECVNTFLHPHLRNELLSLLGNLGVLIFLGYFGDFVKFGGGLIVLRVLDQVLCDLKGYSRDGVLAVCHELIGVSAYGLTHFESFLEAVEGFSPILHRDGCGSIIVEFCCLGHVLGGCHACCHERGSDRENKLFHRIKNYV